MSDCVRKIQIGSERWTQADQELEDWLHAHGFYYTMGVDYREDAQTDDEWEQYAENVKAYALKCKDEYDFMDVDEHVEGLVPTAPSHDIRDKNGRRIAIVD